MAPQLMTHNPLGYALPHFLGNQFLKELGGLSFVNLSLFKL